MRTSAELAAEFVESLSDAPLVTREDDGYFVFHDPNCPVFSYDFRPRDAADALEWAAHMAEKSWVTTQHLAAYCRWTSEVFKGTP